MKTMAELHRFTYTKIGHAPNHCKDTISDRIADFINTALCEIVLANHKIPETKAEAAVRAAHIFGALSQTKTSCVPFRSAGKRQSGKEAFSPT